MPPIIEVQGLRKTFRVPDTRRDTVREHVLGVLRPRAFRTLTVLDGVDFRIEPGTTVGLMGRNGSGKSTLLRVLAGIYRPDGGRVHIAGGVTALLELGVGFNPELDAIDNVLLTGSVMGLSLRALRASLDEIIDFAGVREFANLELRHYSSGMAARLAYAVAFRAVREVLILDEVFAVGDLGFRTRCEERCRQLQASGHTILLVSHAPHQIVQFCDRALLLEGGRIVEDADAATVAAAYSRIVM